MKTYVYLWQYVAEFFWELEMFQTNLQRKSKHILDSVSFFFENRAVYEIMWKNMVQPECPQMTI
jgi:hypothetical protein